jgi:ribosome-associated protein
LRFEVQASPSLPEPVRTRLLHLARNRINSEGVLLIDARSERTQERNRQEAINRLVGLIRQAAIRPKKRLKSKPSRAARERRLEKKRQRSEKKQRRGKVQW